MVVLVRAAGKVLIALTLTFTAIPAKAEFVADGDFSSWVFDSDGAATVQREPANGHPDARLNITTTSGIGVDVVGAAIDNAFVTDLPIAGDAFVLSLDVLSGQGAFGQGQGILLLVEQNASIYGTGLGVTGFPHNWDTVTFHGFFTAGDFALLIGGGPPTPDFDGGILTRFGFAGSNSASGTLTQYYDNFSLTYSDPAQPVPEPSSLCLATIGTLSFGLLWLRRRQGAAVSARLSDA